MARRIDVCFTGPMFRHAGTPLNPALALAEALEDQGLRCRTVSPIRQPILRFAHIAVSLVLLRLRCGAISMQMYSSRSFRGDACISVIARLLRYRVIMMLHGGGFPDLIARDPARVRRVLVRAHSIVAPSAYLADAVQALGLTAQVIPNIVETDAYPYRSPSGTPSILWMRTLHPVYDPELALATLVALRTRGIDARMTIAGEDRGEMERVRLSAVAAGVEGQLRLPGFLDADGKRRAFAEHDFLLNTPLVDNAPTSLLEAAAAGLVVVSVAVGGIPKLFTDGRDAVLVQERDPETLADAIAALLERPDRMAALSAEGRGLAQRCDPERVASQWASLLSQKEVHDRARR